MAQFTYTFSPSTVAKSAEVNQNFTDISNVLETGWAKLNYSLTYASATTITVAGVDLTGVLTPGMKMKVTNNSTTKYFVVTEVTFSTNSTITVSGSVDLSNSAITDPFYSTSKTPQGFPETTTNSDGWSDLGETLTYASASSVTVAGVDLTDIIQIGDKIKLTNDGSVKYYIISGVSFSTDTTINLLGTALANSAITDPFYSKTATPQGVEGMQVLRQDDTINTVKDGNIILTGWGYIQGDGVSPFEEEAVTFGVTFAETPIVVVGFVGVKNGANPTDVGDTETLYQGVATADTIATTGFTASVSRTDGVAIIGAYRMLYSWIAIGKL